MRLPDLRSHTTERAGSTGKTGETAQNNTELGYYQLGSMGSVRMPLMPNILLNASVSTTTPGSSEAFCYGFRYRCASLTEHCYNAQITFELPSSMTITSLPNEFGNVANVTQSGNSVTIELVSPPGTGAPAGALASGSAGLVKVCAKFKCAGEAGVAAGTSVNLTGVPTFSVDGGSVTAAAPAVTVPTLNDCPVSLPPTPPGSFEKTTIGNSRLRCGMPGSFGGWRFEVPVRSAPFCIIDTFPEGFRLSTFEDLQPGYSLEVDCGSGFVPIATGTDGSRDDVGRDVLDPNDLDPGDFILDTLGNPTDCTADFWTAVDGSEVGYISNAIALKLNVPANDTDGAVYDFRFYIEEGVTVGTYQNVARTTVPNEFPASGEEFEVFNTGYDLQLFANCTERIGAGLTDNSDFDQVNPFLTVDPLDIQMRIQIANSALATQDIAQGFVVEALLDETLSFVTDPDNPNYWAIHQDPNQVQYLPTCANPAFDIILNHTGAQTLLRWTFPPSCILEAGYTDNFGNQNNGENRFPEIYFSARFNLSAPIGGSLGASITAYLSDGAAFGKNETVASQNSSCSTPNGASVNSAKYVNGGLNQGFSRYPMSGSTTLDGNGDYEMYIYQSGFDEISDIHLADILPYIGDVDLLSPGTTRGSEWSMELSGPITVERYKIGMGLIDASPDLGTGGVYYSTDTNPCYLDALNDIDVPNGTNGTAAGCTSFMTGVSPVGARSFGFHWSNAADPLVFGEYLKVTFSGVQLSGEPDMVDLEIAWNSFAFTTTNTNDDILTSQPLKVGLKMIDESAYASIGNRVWKDFNANGLQDPGEQGIAGVSVSLYHPDGTPVEDVTTLNGVTTNVPVTAVTDSSGLYCFYGLPPGEGYIVRLDNPANFIGSGPLAPFVLTPVDQGSDDTRDSDAGMGNGGGLFTDSYPEILAVLSPSAAEKDESYDFGFTQLGEICGRAFLDQDGEGDEDPNEPGQANVIVIAKDLGGTEIARDTTDASGYYNIAIAPGTYNLCVDMNSVVGYAFTFSNATGEDVTDSDANSMGVIGPISVLECGDVQCDNDIGLITPLFNAAIIKGAIWDELVKDGSRASTEAGVSGIEVYLLNADGFVLTSTTTDADGNYEFGNLPPGVGYSVSISPGVNIALTSPMDAGTDDSVDSDFDPATGVTANITPAANECVANIDGGICGLYSIGNLVFEDINNNGVYDGGEGIFPGITVRLYDNNTMTYVDTTQTDGNGKYVFTGLDPGDYIVEVELPAGGYQSSTDIGTTATPNSLDSDDNGNGTTTTGTVQSSVLTIAADAGTPGDPNWLEDDHGQPINGEIDRTSNPKAYYTVDFGFFLTPPCIFPAFMADAVPVPCVDATFSNSGYLQISTATNATHYNFTAGSDYLTGDMDINNATAFDPSSDLPLTFGMLPNPSGSQDYTIRVFNAESDCFTDLTVTMTEQNCPVSLGDTTWIDLNANGLQDAGEPPLEGVTVTLFTAAGVPVVTDFSGNTVTPATTDANGFYEFTNLPVGDYYVVFDIGTVANSGFYEFTTQNIANETKDSDANPLDGRSDNTGLIAPGQRYPHLDAGVVCRISAEAGNKQTLCSRNAVDLTNIGATFTPTGITGFGATWTSDGTGTFDDGAGVFGVATTYTPSAADIANGRVMLSLTTDDPRLPPLNVSACSPVMDEVLIAILKVDCGSFPWDGN